MQSCPFNADLILTKTLFTFAPAQIHALCSCVQVKGGNSKQMDQSDVVKAAEDITKVIKDGKQDDASVKSVLSESKTHGGILTFLSIDVAC